MQGQVVLAMSLVLEVNRPTVSDAAVQAPPVVEGFDIVEDSKACFLFGVERAVDLYFSFQCGPEELHGGVVIEVASASCAGRGPVLQQIFREFPTPIFKPSA